MKTLKERFKDFFIGTLFGILIGLNIAFCFICK